MKDLGKERGETAPSSAGMAQVPDTGLHPFPGLRPFEDSENHIFFGRDRQVEQIIDHMQRFHVAAVMGGSGCGKSSIVRAGVIPRLHAYGISSAGDAWLFVIFTPQNQPITRLANALDDLLEPCAERERQDERRQQIRELLLDPDGLEYFLEDFGAELAVEEGLEELRERARLLVIVDQFEEILRDDDHGDSDLTPEDNKELANKRREAKALADLILHCFRKEPEVQERGDSPRERLYLMITLRTEDLHKCAEYLELPEVLNQCSFMARRLNESELETAIKSPPAMIARHIEGAEAGGHARKPTFDTDLLSLIYDDLARNKSDPDHLPLLQHLLYRLWECAQEREDREIPDRITLQDLDGALRLATPTEAAPTGSGPELDEQARRDAYRRPLALCLERQANRIFAQLDPLEQEVARVMFQALAHVDTAGNYTRRWTTREKVHTLAGNVTKLGGKNDELAEKDLIARVLQAFSAPKHPYLRGGAESESGKIDVSHEAFIRKWPLFGKKWLVEDQEADAAYVKLLDSFRSCSDRCGGTPTLLKRLRSLCAERLGKSSRQMVAKYRLTRRGAEWAGMHGHSQKEYRQVVDFYHASKNLAHAGWALSVVAIFGTFAALIVMLVLGKQAQMFEAEANVFQPFGVAARMDRPRVTRPGEEQLENYRYALWEGAVALKTLRDHFTEADRKSSLSGKENQLRVARAERLALSTVNEASQALLSLPVWDLGGEPRGGAGDLAKVRYDLVGAKDDPCLGSVIIPALGWPADVRVHRRLLPGQGGLPERHLYFKGDSEKPAWVAFASLADGLDPARCVLVTHYGEGPGSELGYVDPQLRFVAVVREVQGKDGKRTFRYLFRSIQWGLEGCEDPAHCELVWAGERGSTELKVFQESKERRHFYASSDGALIRLGLEGENARFFAVGTPTVRFRDDLVLGSTSDEACKPKTPSGSDHRAAPPADGKGDPAQRYQPCTRKELGQGQDESLVAAARPSEQDPGEQIVEIWRRDRGISGDEGEQILAYPIARLTVKAPVIDRLRFVDDPRQGRLDVGFESGKGEGIGLTWTWGDEAVLGQTCDLLRRLPAEEIDTLQKAVDTRHSAFFSQVSRQVDGTIALNNRLDRICPSEAITEEDRVAEAPGGTGALAQTHPGQGKPPRVPE